MSEGTDGRLKKELGVARRDRAEDDRKVTQNREISDAERLEMFRLQMFQNALPDLPPIEGYHVCWLTTENPRDPVHQRLRLGYELISAADVPGMELSTLKTGDYAGCVGINEMIAAKLPMSLYQMYMKEAHYNAPREQEELLVRRAEDMKDEAARAGTTLIEDEGFQELHREPVAPTRFE